MTLEIRVDGPGVLPDYATEGAAGADLRAAEAITLPAGGRAAVATGLFVEIPAGYVGLVWPRSGLAVRHGIDTLAGVIGVLLAGTFLGGAAVAALRPHAGHDSIEKEYAQ